MERLTRISLETAKLAQELGYSWKSDINYYYFEGKLVRDWLIPPFGNQEAYLAPEQDLLAKWLRDVHKIYIGILYKDYEENKYELNLNYDRKIGGIYKEIYSTFEEAVENGIKESLLYLKELNKDMK